MIMTSSPNLPRSVLGILFLGGLIATSFWILRPFLAAAVWAIMIVVATWPLKERVAAYLGGRQSPAILLMLLLLLLAFFGPLAIVVASLVEHADAFASLPKTIASLQIPLPPDWVAKIPVGGARLSAAWRNFAESGAEELATMAAPYQQAVSHWVLAQLGGASLKIIDFLLTILIAAILYAKGDMAAEGATRFAVRLAGVAGERAVNLAGQAIRGVALGVVVTAIVQAVLSGICLALADVPLPVVLSGIIFVLSLAQIGPGPIMFIAACWLYWGQDQTAWAIVTFVWGFLVDRLNTVMLPILIKRGADLPLLLVFAGVIGGLLSFGLVGIFIGPVVLAVSYKLLEAWVGGEPESLETRAGAQQEKTPQSEPALSVRTTQGSVTP